MPEKVNMIIMIYNIRKQVKIILTSFDHSFKKYLCLILFICYYLFILVEVGEGAPGAARVRRLIQPPVDKSHSILQKYCCLIWFKNHFLKNSKLDNNIFVSF